MNIKSIFFVFPLLLVACSDDNSNAIEKHLESGYLVKNDGWSVLEVTKEKGLGYYASVRMSENDMRTYNMLYTLAKRSGDEYFSNMDELEEKYRELTESFCPNASTPEGKQFWSSVSIKSFTVSPYIEGQLGTFASVYCKKNA
ncbi:hypothetical protein HC752_02965 [Vibrio sp. S9_S30]|uniref:hypothetical protein n=1 Tax=Vibrio sp. S9_S30 TaxID=2720226 RepID=UPI0016818567|nr:hypothetical protein [Vibrio sp. S9_S30]MBD1555884.1 hypothetical protein [Vibrio sp. S9_S30]